MPTITILPLACAGCGIEIQRAHGRKRCDTCQRAHRADHRTPYDPSARRESYLNEKAAALRALLTG